MGGAGPPGGDQERPGPRRPPPTPPPRPFPDPGNGSRGGRGLTMAGTRVPDSEGSSTRVWMAEGPPSPGGGQPSPTAIWDPALNPFFHSQDPPHHQFRARWEFWESRIRPRCRLSLYSLIIESIPAMINFCSRVNLSPSRVGPCHLFFPSPTQFEV